MPNDTIDRGIKKAAGDDVQVLITNTSLMKDMDRTVLPSSWMHLPIIRTVLQPM